MEMGNICRSVINELNDLRNWIVDNIITPGENRQECYFRSGGAFTGMRDSFLETVGDLKTAKSIITRIDEIIKEWEDNATATENLPKKDN